MEAEDFRMLKDNRHDLRLAPHLIANRDVTVVTHIHVRADSRQVFPIMAISLVENM